jgi:hypothetical protein
MVLFQLGRVVKQMGIKIEGLDPIFSIWTLLALESGIQ